MCYVLVEAWLFSFPMTPISLLYSFCRMNTSIMNRVGVLAEKCQNSNTAALDNAIHLSVSLLSTAQYDVYSAQQFPHSFHSSCFSENDQNDHCHCYQSCDMPRHWATTGRGSPEWSCANIWCSSKYQVTVENKVLLNRSCKRQAKEWLSQSNNSCWSLVHPPGATA